MRFLSNLVPLIFGFSFASADYRIENCDSATPGINYAVALAREASVRAYVDSQLGVNSRHGFKALFKYNGVEGPLRSLLIKIMHLPPTIVSGIETDPTLICVSPDVGQRYNPGFNPWTYCTTFPTLSGFYAAGTPWIFLCPRFVYSVEPEPVIAPGLPLNTYCPSVHNNLFVGSPDLFVDYQLYGLVYMFARFYLQGAALTDATVPQRVGGLNECVGLGALPAAYSPCVRNADNLVYYVAMVMQLCLQAPDPFAPPFTGSKSLDNATSVLYNVPLTNTSTMNSANLAVDA